ncbi:MAG: Uma2 family endonuclease [Synechococcaceae cyanobacterium]
MLTLPDTQPLTPEQFAELCAANPEAVLELDADGTLIEMTPTGGSTSARNSALLFQLQAWARASGGWIVFDSSGGFRLPDGSVRSPDASLVRLDRWRALSEAERDGFPPLCPDLVVELASPSDDPPALRRKLAAYLTNGARLGWLLLPLSRSVEVWTPEPADGTPTPARLPADAQRLEAGQEFPGLSLDLAEIWGV